MKLTPTLYAVLSSLPRGARIEKQVLVHSGRFVTSDPESSREEDGEDDELVVDKSPEFAQGNIVHLYTVKVPHQFGIFWSTLSRNKNKDDITVQHPEYRDAEIQIRYEISGFPPSSEACAIVFVRDSDTPSMRDALVSQAASQMKAIQGFTPFLKRTLAAKVFVSHRSSMGGRRMSNICPFHDACLKSFPGHSPKYSRCPPPRSHV